jgi:hypothetical protein
MKYVGRLRKLEKLDLTATRVGDVGLLELKSLTELRELVITGTPVGDLGLEHVTALPKLEIIEAGVTGITDKGLHKLKEMKSLRRASFWNSDVSGDAVKALRKARPDLEISN